MQKIGPPLIRPACEVAAPLQATPIHSGATANPKCTQRAGFRICNRAGCRTCKGAAAKCHLGRVCGSAKGVSHQRHQLGDQPSHVALTAAARPPLGISSKAAHACACIVAGILALCQLATKCLMAVAGPTVGIATEATHTLCLHPEKGHTSESMHQPMAEAGACAAYTTSQSKPDPCTPTWLVWQVVE